VQRATLLQRLQADGVSGHSSDDGVGGGGAAAVAVEVAGEGREVREHEVVEDLNVGAQVACPHLFEAIQGGQAYIRYSGAEFWLAHVVCLVECSGAMPKPALLYDPNTNFDNFIKYPL
jgi:hypothetical protein